MREVKTSGITDIDAYRNRLVASHPTQPHLVIVLEVRDLIVVVNYDGRCACPGPLHPLDVARGHVGGEVVPRRQHRVQPAGDPLGEDAWTRDTGHRTRDTRPHSPMMGLLFSSWQWARVRTALARTQADTVFMLIRL